MPEQLKEYIDSPARWPLRPYLPMKRIDDDGLECGLMIEGSGLTIYQHGGDVIQRFHSIDEIHEAGWKID